MDTKYQVTINTLEKMQERVTVWSKQNLSDFNLSITANANANPSECRAYAKQNGTVDGGVRTLDFVAVEIEIIKLADVLFHQYNVVKSELDKESEARALEEFERDLVRLEEYANFSFEKFWNK